MISVVPEATSMVYYDRGTCTVKVAQFLQLSQID